MDDDRRKDEDTWDKKSREQSEKNYVLGETMGNPWNNTKNPNWRNYILKTGFRSEMLNDPQRVEDQNQIEDNNYNKELLDKDEKV